MKLFATPLSLGLAAALAACGAPNTPTAQPTAQRLRQLGTFRIDSNPATGVSTLTMTRPVYSELPFGEDGNTGTNPGNSIQAVTLSADLPTENGCPAGVNCFAVQLTNFTGAAQGGVFVGIDSITPATGRALLLPDATPPGVIAPLGGRNFGDLADLASSGILDMDVTIPDLASYVVTGSFWGDDGNQGGPVTINFDGYPANTLITNQEASAVFASTAGFEIRALAFGGGNSAPNVIAPHVAGGPLSANNETIVDFTSPVNGLTFRYIGSNNAGIMAQVDVFESGMFSATVGLDGTGVDFLVGAVVDLSAFTNVTRIRIHTVTDGGGIGFDDFNFNQ